MTFCNRGLENLPILRDRMKEREFSKILLVIGAGEEVTYSSRRRAKYIDQ